MKNVSFATTKINKYLKTSKMAIKIATEGTKENPWKLRSPPLTSYFEMYKDERDGNEVIVCVVGKTKLYYQYRLSLIHISEPTRLGMISSAVFCLKKKNR